MGWCAMRSLLVVLIVVLCATPCFAYTPERNLATIGQAVRDDLWQLKRFADFCVEWPVVEAVVLVGGSLALRFLPRKTLIRYMGPMTAADRAKAAEIVARNTDRLNAQLGRELVRGGSQLLKMLKGFFR